VRRKDRNGLRIARLFRQARGLTDAERACDLHRLLVEDEIDLAVSDLPNPGYTACLVCPGPGFPSGIIVAPGQSHGRERFSIAHELGHYHIPTHKNRPPGWCGEEDMVARADSGRQYEWEANDFAAELLMPRSRFQYDLQGRDPVFRDLFELASADMYDVSVTAAALRYVELTSEACALVCAEEGLIKWVAKADAFRYTLPWRGDSLPAASIARAVFSGEQANDGLEALEPHVWLDTKQNSRLELFESTLAIPSQRQVLSLIWAVADDSEHDE
jgi:hypothetical protein